MLQHTISFYALNTSSSSYFYYFLTRSLRSLGYSSLLAYIHQLSSFFSAFNISNEIIGSNV